MLSRTLPNGFAFSVIKLGPRLGRLDSPRVAIVAPSLMCDAMIPTGGSSAALAPKQTSPLTAIPIPLVMPPKIQKKPVANSASPPKLKTKTKAQAKQPVLRRPAATKAGGSATAGGPAKAGAGAPPLPRPGKQATQAMVCHGDWSFSDLEHPPPAGPDQIAAPDVAAGSSRDHEGQGQQLHLPLPAGGDVGGSAGEDAGLGKRQHYPQYRHCPLCHWRVREGVWRDHVRKCVASYHMSPVPLFEKYQHVSVLGINVGDGPKLTFAVCAGFQLEAVKMMWDHVMILGKDYWFPLGTRPAHHGALQLVGYNPLLNKEQHGTTSLRKFVQYFFNSWMQHTQMMPVLKGIMASDVYNYIVEEISTLKRTLGSAEGPKAFFGINYMPAVEYPEELGWHAPPPALAKVLGVKSCHETCQSCREDRCVNCVGCVMNLDHLDPIATAGLSLYIVWQRPATKAAERAYFVLDDRVFPLNTTFSALFDGSRVPHGVWAPSSAVFFRTAKLSMTAKTRTLCKDHLAAQMVHLEGVSQYQPLLCPEVS